MVAVGTYIAGKFVFRDGFKNAGWQWSKPRHYLYAFGLALFLWVFPRVVEQLLGIYEAPQEISTTTILTEFLLSFTITLIPAFGEEFGWRGYLLPRLFTRYSTRYALLLHGFILGLAPASYSCDGNASRWKSSCFSISCCAYQFDTDNYARSCICLHLVKHAKPGCIDSVSLRI
jgi:membrane protease YdiL (CAAX protease family)